MVDPIENAAIASASELAGLDGPRRRRSGRDRLDSSHLPGPAELRLRLDTLRAATAEHLRRSKSEATQHAYRSDMAAFSVWCDDHALEDLPAEPDAVALYLTACDAQGAAVATLRRRLVAISQAHKAAGLPSPTQTEVVRRVLSGITRIRGARPRQVTALRLAQLRRVLEATPEDTLVEVRDRALLLLGFASGMRRSELAALRVRDLRFVDEGVDVLIARSKTDQEGEGRTIGIPRGRHPDTDPVLALRRWLSLAALQPDAPLFVRIRPTGRPPKNRPEHPPGHRPIGELTTLPLRPQGIARVVQRAAARAGLDPEEFAGHSLRSGFATEAAARGAPEHAIMRQTGHRSSAMLRRYIREGDRYRDNATGYLGL